MMGVAEAKEKKVREWAPQACSSEDLFLFGWSGSVSRSFKLALMYCVSKTIDLKSITLDFSIKDLEMLNNARISKIKLEINNLEADFRNLKST